LPFEYNYNKDDFENYIQTLASKIGKEISEDNVNSSVRKILELKEKKGLLEPYDNQNLEENIKNAKDIVSSKENHNEELEIAKKAVTMIKNNNNTLPINTEEKTVILYEYATHANSINNAITLLKNDGNIINESNIKLLPLKNNE
jgi:beta-N-acetylhexosaminidase